MEWEVLGPYFVVYFCLGAILLKDVRTIFGSLDPLRRLFLMSIHATSLTLSAFALTPLPPSLCGRPLSIVPKAGFEHLDDVLAAVFSYLKMMERVGVSERIFREIKEIEDLDFEFREGNSHI